MNKYQKALQDAEEMLISFDGQQKELSAKVADLERQAERAAKQKAEALETGNQKLYQASVFAEDQTSTQLKAARERLQHIERDPLISPEESRKLISTIISGMDNLVSETDLKFIQMVDEVIPQIEEIKSTIDKGNALIKEIKLKLEKDPVTVNQYERTGIINAPACTKDFKSWYIAENLRATDLYKESGTNKREEVSDIFRN